MPKYKCDIGDTFDLLAEEGMEVAIERMKMIRFGPEGTPEWIARGEDSPRTRLIQEVGDFLTIVKLALKRGDIRQEEIDAAEAKKRARLEELYGLVI